MQDAIAFTNNDVVTIAWCYNKKPDNCIGFSITRIDDKGKEFILPSYATFKGQTKKPNQTTKDAPIQKFFWKDVYARQEADKTGNRKFCYKIIPMKKDGNKIVVLNDNNFPTLETNQINLTRDVANNISATFNRGIISTQRVSNYFKNKPQKKTLLCTVSEENNPLRKSLAGDMINTLLSFVNQAKGKGKIYAALYELEDKELLENLTDLKDKLNIILSNSNRKEDDTSQPKYIDKNGKEKYHQLTVDSNQDSRNKLKRATDNLFNRMLPNNQIGHNKFLVYVDENNRAQSVLFGSTNWTSTGLCTQTNNTVVIQDTDLANQYLNYWEELKLDTEKAGNNTKELQGKDLRTWDAKGKIFSKIQNIDVLESWFSPNTPALRKAKVANEKTPPDMSSVIDHINKAKEAILFLVFYPGTPSVANWTADALKKNKDLFVRGCVSNKSASEGFYYELKGIKPPKKVKGEKKEIKQDYRVIGAEAFDGNVIPNSWREEILNAGFAIIHDKIIVIDPFSTDCVVITGCHNLGFKASYNNDENFAIIKGNTKLALAYASHVLDVYDHFAFRYWYKMYGTKDGDYNLENTPEEWLSKYYDKKGNINNSQLKFWLSGINLKSKL